MVQSLKSMEIGERAISDLQVRAGAFYPKRRLDNITYPYHRFNHMQLLLANRVEECKSTNYSTCMPPDLIHSKTQFIAASFDSGIRIESLKP